MTESQATPNTDIVAYAGRYYRNARYLITVLFLFFGLWFIRDGYFVYPRQNLEARNAVPPRAEPHPGFDIPFNRTLGIILPPLSLLILIRALYNSRGSYRLSGTILSVPGHPPISLDAIRKIDKSLWDRKGIAYIEYELPNSPQLGRLKLDDFVYDRTPTDQILERIEAHIRQLIEPTPEKTAP